MNSFPTLILSPRFTEGSIALWRAAIALGWDVHRLINWSFPRDEDPVEPVLSGEPLFLSAIANQLGLVLAEPPIDFLTKLPEEYVRREIKLMTAIEARAILTPHFIKPPNEKMFRAGVYASGAELPAMPDEDPVLVANPVDWIAEFRYFIRDRQVITWSPYWLNGALARDGDRWIVERKYADQTAHLVARVLADPRVELPPAVVLDAGIIRGIGAAIVEANLAPASGLYGCNPTGVLEVLRTATSRR